MAVEVEIGPVMINCTLATTRAQAIRSIFELLVLSPHQCISALADWNSL